MSEMHLIWTTLPSGIHKQSDNNQWLASISVFLTPRLGTGDGKRQLADFPAMVDWPATLLTATSKLSFTIQLRDGYKIISEQSAEPLLSESRSPVTAAWQSLFNPATKVQSFDAPDTDRRAPVRTMLSYDTRAVIKAVRQVYADQLHAELSGESDQYRHSMLNASPIDDQPLTVSELLLKWKTASNSPLDQFALFHRRIKSRVPTVKVTDDDDQMEFHRMIGALGNHPTLLRKFGLVFDIAISLSDLGLTDQLTDPSIRVFPQGLEIENAAHIANWTAVEYSELAVGNFQTFTSRALETPRKRHGLLALGSPGISMFQEQHEYATLTLMQHLSAEDNSPGLQRTLPALLQGGMRLADPGAEALLIQSISRQSELESSLQSVLRHPNVRTGNLASEDESETIGAEAITRGYRIDVRDVDDGPWRSLCGRLGHYRSANWSWGSATHPIEEEGFIEPVVQWDGSPEQEVFRAPEDLFEWQGWSLVLPRPSSGQNNTGDTDSPDSLPIKSNFQVPPGSLTPQRFGHRYQFRARLVDIAGNSISVSDANGLAETHQIEALVSAPAPCLRVESAKPPVLIPTKPPGPGETGDVIVIRDAESKVHRISRTTVHLLPPGVPLRLIEMHGIFDQMSGEKSWRLIEGHQGVLPETVSTPDIYTPYLPDPLVRQAVLYLPGSKMAIDMPAFDDLPSYMRDEEFARSCCLVVEPTEDDISAQKGDRKVTIKIPKGREVMLQIAAKLGPEELAVLAQSHWLDQSDPQITKTSDIRGTQIPNKLAQLAAQGRASVVAPAREIKVVHACQRPLSAPVFGEPRILPRDDNATTAVLTDSLFIFDQASSGHLDIYAQWQDPLDIKEFDGWRSVESNLHAFGLRVADDLDNPLDAEAYAAAARSPLIHEFGDTKHHEVEYRAEALSRFVNYYPAELSEDKSKMTRVSAPIVVHVPATAPPARPQVSYVMPTIKRVSSLTGAAWVGDQYRAVQRGEGLRIYMERGWFSSGKGEQLALVLANTLTPESLTEQVSTWGNNPVRRSKFLEQGLGRDQLRGVENFITYSQDQGSVDLAVYDVQFSKEHGLPFADIEFAAQQSFMPFVKLALARYQPYSIQGSELSSVVRAEFVPLTPSRSLTVKKSGIDTWSLIVRGFSYKEAANNREKTSVIRAHLECISTATPMETAAWRQIGDAIQMTPDEIQPFQFQWTGEIGITQPEFGGKGWQWQLVVQEFELFDSMSPKVTLLEERSRIVSAHVVPLTQR